jgi:lysophospholipase L1-like esterase
MKNVFQKTILLVCSLAFSLFLAELAVSFIKPQNLSGSWRVATENGLLVNKSSGSARHQFGDRVVTYSFAAPHLRGPIHNGLVKVLVLGDSFTFGWLLDDRHKYVNLLQRQIDQEFGLGTFSLLNAAAGGWGTGDYVVYVEDFAEELKPDLILVFLNADDIGRAMKSHLWIFDRTSGVLTRTAAPASKIKQAMNAIPGYQWLLENSHLMQLARTAALGLQKPKSIADEQAESPMPDPVKSGPRSNLDTEASAAAKALGAVLFDRLKNWCRNNNVDLIVTTTGWHQPPYSQPEPTEAFMAGAKELFGTLGVPFWDPSAQLWQRRKNAIEIFSIPNDGHPNEAGSALIAEHVYPFLSSQLNQFCQRSHRCEELNEEDTH